MAKLGTGIFDARMANARMEKGASVDSVKGERWSELKEKEKKKRQSHRQIPKQAPKKQIGVLRKLPEGYGIFQTRPTAEGIETANLYDTYIIGSAVGWFDSVDSFIPHLDWIDRGMLNERPCTCKQCTNKASPKISNNRDLENEGNERGNIPTGAEAHQRRRSSASKAAVAGGSPEIENNGARSKSADVAYVIEGSNSKFVNISSSSQPHHSNKNKRSSTSPPSPPAPKKRRFSDNYSPPPSTQILIPLGRGNTNQRQELLAKTSYSATCGVASGLMI